MPYTSPSTVVTSTPITSAWGNSVKAATDYLANPPACRVFNSVDINLADNAFTTLTFDSERYDTDSMHSTAATTDRITFNTAGLYVVSGTVNFTSAADYALIALFITLNGTTPPIAAHYGQNTAVATDPTITLTTVYKFAAGDFVILRAFQDNTANVTRAAKRVANYSPEFSATWIGTG